jgi:hypothetical protein
MSKFQQFCKTMGLHPLVGFGMLVVDWMLFAAEGSTLGGSWIVSVGIAIALTVPCILIQRYGFKDEWGFAIGKGLLIGCLTAIPAPLPSVVPFLGGVFGVLAPSKSSNSNDTEKQHPTLTE